MIGGSLGHGTITVKCIVCSGSGTVTHTSCSGAGQLKCLLCEGSGKLAIINKCSHGFKVNSSHYLCVTHGSNVARFH